MPSSVTAADSCKRQASLFEPPDSARAVASGVRFIAADPATSDAALAGDGYGWLAAALPTPRPPACPACRRPAVLPARAPVVWTCPHCHPMEA